MNIISIFLVNITLYKVILSPFYVNNFSKNEFKEWEEAIPTRNILQTPRECLEVMMTGNTKRKTEKQEENNLNGFANFIEEKVYA